MFLPTLSQKSLIKASIIVLAFLLSFFVTAPVYATGISLTPVRSILNTLPDQKLEVKFTIENQDPVARKFELIPAQVLGEDVVTEPSISKVEWLSISRNEINLAANSSQEIAASVSVPADAASGSYKLLVLAREVNLPTQPGVGTGITMAAGYPIEVNVIKELPKANLQAFIDVSPSFSLEETFNVELDIQNTGNISLYPILYLKVFNPTGDVIFQQTLNSEQLVLPAKNSIKQEFEFKAGNGNLISSTGEFTAEIIAVDSQLQISAKDAQKFVYIPAVLAVGTIFITGALLWLLIKLLRKITLFKRQKTTHSTTNLES